MILKPLLFVLLFLNYLVADTINLKQGWNLVGISSQMTLQELKTQVGDDNLLVVSGGGETYKKGQSPAHLNNFVAFKPESGYWIKVDQNSSLEFTPQTTTSSIDLQAGWNLINPQSFLTLQMLCLYARSVINLQGSVVHCLKTAKKYEYVKNAGRLLNRSR